MGLVTVSSSDEMRYLCAVRSSSARSAKHVVTNAKCFSQLEAWAAFAPVAPAGRAMAVGAATPVAGPGWGRGPLVVGAITTLARQWRSPVAVAVRTQAARDEASGGRQRMTMTWRPPCGSWRGVREEEAGGEGRGTESALAAGLTSSSVPSAPVAGEPLAGMRRRQRVVKKKVLRATTMRRTSSAGMRHKPLRLPPRTAAATTTTTMTSIRSRRVGRAMGRALHPLVVRMVTMVTTLTRSKAVGQATQQARRRLAPSRRTTRPTSMPC